jgi:anti-sigma-K factor RskA
MPGKNDAKQEPVTDIDFQASILAKAVMKVEGLFEKLIASARANPPSDAVPYAFEKRVMAHLAAAGVPDWWTLWSGALWRAAAPCVAITVLLSAWTFYSGNGTPTHEPLGADLENTVLAAIDHPGDVW